LYGITGTLYGEVTGITTPTPCSFAITPAIEQEILTAPVEPGVIQLQDGPPGLFLWLDAYGGGPNNNSCVSQFQVLSYPVTGPDTGTTVLKMGSYTAPPTGDDGTATVTWGSSSALTITSANSASFVENVLGSFTVTTTGDPAAALLESGPLPANVQFVDNHDGTATVTGTPAVGTAGSYPITITASNGIGADATQSFTLNVQPGSGPGGSAFVDCPGPTERLGTTFPPVNFTRELGNSKISFGSLGLTWKLVNPSAPGDICSLSSDLGKLPVLVTVFGKMHQVSTSEATVALDFLPDAPQALSCNWTNTSNNCLLNKLSSEPTIVRWSTTGFVQDVNGKQRPLTSTGPLTYYVDTSSLSCAPRTTSNDVKQVLQCVELFIHTTLISHLTTIMLQSLALVKDPPDNALVTDSRGRESGVTANGRTVNAIPGAVVITTPKGGAVAIVDPRDSSYSAQATGARGSQYSLSLGTLDLLSGASSRGGTVKDVQGSLGPNGTSKTFTLSIPQPRSPG